jgi:hypothetical protein
MPRAVSGPNWSRTQAKRPWHESWACPVRPLRIAYAAFGRGATGGAVGSEGRKGSLCVLPGRGVCSVEVPERREPVQPPAVKAHLGHSASQPRAAAAPEPASPLWGADDMVWPVARLVEEVSVVCIVDL